MTPVWCNNARVALVWREKVLPSFNPFYVMISGSSHTPLLKLWKDLERKGDLPGGVS